MPHVDHPFVTWLCDLAPGTVIETDASVTITHTGEEDGSDQTSTLWKRSADTPLLPQLGPLESLYRAFDGADLFCSTFKIASLSESKYIGSVSIVDPIPKLVEDFAAVDVAFPEPSTPFMNDSGQWVYAVGHASGRIHEWDVEVGEYSGEYASIEEIIQEWFSNVFG